MLIKTIQIHNFYSFKDATINFEDYQGIVQVLGKNLDSNGSNGAGKSVLFEAVIWSLYNKTIRKSTEQSLVNNQVGRDCKVSIELETTKGDKILIERGKRPTLLNLYIDGVLKNEQSAAETQTKIEELIQSDYKSFLASVVFGQHVDVDFLSSTPDEKRNIIRNCFSLENIFKMREAVKVLKSQYTAEIKSLTTILDPLKKDCENAGKAVPDKKYKYVELPKLEDILAAEKKISDLKSQVQEWQTQLSEAKKTKAKNEDLISKGAYVEESDCPVCKGKYVKSQTIEDLKIIEERVLASTEWMISLSDAISKHKAEIESLKPAYSSVEWAKWNEKNKLVLDANRAQEKYEKLLAQVKAHEDSIKTSTNNLEVMKFWEKAFSEQGIIRYIIRNILEFFNLKSNEYLSVLTNNQFVIEFADDLSEKITNNGVETSFISLSGGEKRKVNMAIMLALQELQNQISRTQCNLMFFDEVAENLDSNSMEAMYNLLNILKNKHPNKVFLLITHNNYLLELFSEAQKIEVVKSKGISRINGRS